MCYIPFVQQGAASDAAVLSSQSSRGAKKEGLVLLNMRVKD